MKKKYSFPELGCSSCTDYQAAGSLLTQTRYCHGFPRKKTPKRFRSSDPQIKAPRWCPKRLSPPVCRIYGFADACGRWLEMEKWHAFDPKKYSTLIPNENHYKLRWETSLGLTAKQFYEAAQKTILEEVLCDSNVEYGEVIEIDDGLKPYYFYCYNSMTVIPVFFNRTRCRQEVGE